MPWVTVNGTSLYVEVEGRGTAVVLLHEIGGSLRSWDAVTPALAQKMRVIRYDQRGFGLSEKVRAPYTIETLGDDLRELIGHVELTTPFHLVSLAASAMQALEFYRRDPGRVASLVFCNPAPGVDPSRADALNDIADKAEHDGIRGILPAMLDRSYPPELSSREVYENYRGRYLANDPVGFALAFRMMAATNMIGLLGTIACPALVVAGRQDKVRSVAVTEGLAKMIPGARFVSIDAGHFMPVTSPEALVTALREFWNV